MTNGHRLGGLIGEREQHSVEEEMEKNGHHGRVVFGAKVRNDSPGICRKYEVKRNISSARYNKS